MTPEQLEEIPGIGEKTLEKIGIAVRNYFSRFEEAALAAEGDEGLAATAPTSEAGEIAVADGAQESAESTETSDAGAALAEGSLDNAEPPLAGKETEEIATEEAEAENSAEVIEEAVSVGDAEAEEEHPAKEDGA
jgi:N utilization substance protein A